MDIGTAKPGPELLRRLPHRLIDIREPSEQYSAGDFVRLADEAAADIHRRGLLPVISGGTGFYIRSFILGMPEAPPSDPVTRAEVAKDLERLGPEALREELRRADPVSAARIHINDSYRLTRALEVVRSSGRALSDFVPPAVPRASYDFLVVALERPREELYARIDARVEAMFEAGLETEVETLKSRGFGAEAPGMKAIGYAEFFEPGLEGEALRERIQRDTRRYAKRQETFFSSIPGLVRLPAGPEAAQVLAALIAQRESFSLYSPR
jgi:tRNA dimethylallyltransferase